MDAHAAHKAPMGLRATRVRSRRFWRCDRARVHRGAAHAHFPLALLYLTLNYQLPTPIRFKGKAADSTNPGQKANSPGAWVYNIGSMEFLCLRRRFSRSQKWPRRDSGLLFLFGFYSVYTTDSINPAHKSCPPVIPEFSRPPAARGRNIDAKFMSRIFTLSTIGFCTLSMISTFVPHR